MSLRNSIRQRRVAALQIMSWIGRTFGAWLGGWLGRVSAALSADHVRQQVREAFAAQVTGLATTGARVFQSRIRNLSAADLPCLRIHTTQEVILDDDIFSTGGFETRPYMQHRTITVRCEALAKTGAGLADLLNTICAEVETAISADPTLGGLSPIHGSYRHHDQTLEGITDQPTGMAVLDFEFVVLTMSDAPNTAL